MTQRPYALLRDLLLFRFEILDDDSGLLVIEKMEKGVAGLLTSDAGMHDHLQEMAHLIGHLAGFDFSARPYVRGLLGDPQQLAARARQLFIRFFTYLGAIDPSVMMLEDIHHADDASLDLLMELVSEQQALPLVMVCLARPTLLQRRPTWGSGQRFHKRLTLEPLDKRDSRELAREILQKVADVPKQLRDLLVERAEGNPLFMEELVKMLIEDRVILKESTEVWRVEESRLGNLRVPPTLAGLLQARFDSLLYPEKLTLQRAAVIGRVFYDSALLALDAADDVHVADLEGVLKHLLGREFIYRRETSSFAGSVEYIFDQNMLRDQIYASLVSRQLKTYHGAMAKWLAASERAEEYLPPIAGHYEQAGETDKAADYLTRAGDRAYQVSALSDATKFYQRALALAPETPQVLIKLGEVERSSGNYPAAHVTLQKALSLAHNDADRAIALATAAQIASEIGDYVEANALLVQALPLARTSGDQRATLRTLITAGKTNTFLGKLTEARTYQEEALALAHILSDTFFKLLALDGLALIALLAGDLDEAERGYTEALARAADVANRIEAARILNNLGEVAKQRGDWVEARSYHQQALAISRELGINGMIDLFLINLADDDTHLGNLDAARVGLYEGMALSLRQGNTLDAVTAVSYFGNVAFAEGNFERALALWGLAECQQSFDATNQRELEMALSHWASHLDKTTIETGLAKGAQLNWGEVLEELLQGA